MSDSKTVSLLDEPLITRGELAAWLMEYPDRPIMRGMHLHVIRPLPICPQSPMGGERTLVVDFSEYYDVLTTVEAK